MRCPRARSAVLVLALAGCARPATPDPVAVPAQDPSPPMCPAGMWPDGGACAAMDAPCPPGQELSYGLGCVNVGEAPSPVPIPATQLPRVASPDLTIDDIRIGSGAVAIAGKRVRVHYTGSLEDGSVFESSWQRGNAFDFDLGKGHVIKGWEEGVVGMRVGGKRRLVIGPSKGYGDRGRPPQIPPAATLVFVIDLFDVK